MRHVTLRLSGLGLVAWLCMGCGAETSGTTETSYGDQIVVDAGLDGASDASADASTDADAATRPINEAFLGHWAHRQVLAGFTELPVFGTTYSETVGTFKWEVIADDDGVLVLMETCSVILRRAEDAVRTVIPPQFIDALPISVRPAQVDGDILTVRYFIELNGVRLANPETDALPTMAEDPRVFDQDGDQEPGMTVLIEGLIDGEVHLVQRTRTRHQGVLGEGVIRGTVQWEADEEILGADNPILVQGASVEPHMESDKSWFVARPIDEAKTCADILAESDALFPEDTGISP